MLSNISGIRCFLATINLDFLFNGLIEIRCILSNKILSIKFDGFLINKDVIIKNLDRNIDYIKKQLLLDNRVILIDVASNSNLNVNDDLNDSENKSYLNFLEQFK